MFSTAPRVRLSPVVLALVLLVCPIAPVGAAAADDAPLFRIFLLEGGSLISYGEFTVVGDRLMFSVPVGEVNGTPTLHIVSVPSSVVDWRRTEEYAAAVRAKRYADTRGEEDFALLASRVTQALNDITLTPDPRRRLAMAEEARRNLAAWPAANYGYRAADVATLVAALDEAVTDLRAASGATPFELNLVATTVAPPNLVAVLPPPDLTASVESAYRAATIAADPRERIDLLRSVGTALASLPSSAGKQSLRERVSSALDAELKVERAYDELTRTAIRDADARVARGDAGGLQQVIARALATDRRLGHQRMGEMSALLAALDLRLSEAHRVRLAREAWEERLDVLREYRRRIEPIVRQVKDLAGALKDIRDRQETSLRMLHRIEIRSTMAIHTLRPIEAPPEMQSTHGQLLASLQLARQAATLHRDALSSKNTQRWWEASSAAAGALMLFERVEAELRALN